MVFAFGLLIAVPIIGLMISAGIGYDESERAPKNRAERAFVSYFLGSQVILIAVGNLFFVLVTLAMSSSDTQTTDTTVSVCEVTKQMGLESGKKYAATPSAHATSPSDDGYFWTDLLGPAGKLDMHADKLRVGFDYRGNASFLSVPLAQTNFVPDTTMETRSTISMKFKCDNTVKATQVTHFGPQHLRLDSGVLLMVRNQIETDAPVVNEKVTAYGLEALLKDQIISIEIRVSPELYTQILG